MCRRWAFSMEEGGCSSGFSRFYDGAMVCEWVAKKLEGVEFCLTKCGLVPQPFQAVQNRQESLCHYSLGWCCNRRRLEFRL